MTFGSEFVNTGEVQSPDIRIQKYSYFM